MAGRPNLPAVLRNDAAADSQAQSGTPHRSRIRRIDLYEALEDHVKFVFRNTPAMILDFDASLIRSDVGR